MVALCFELSGAPDTVSNMVARWQLAYSAVPQRLEPTIILVRSDMVPSALWSRLSRRCLRKWVKLEFLSYIWTLDLELFLEMMIWSWNISWTLAAYSGDFAAILRPFHAIIWVNTRKNVPKRFHGLYTKKWENFAKKSKKKEKRMVGQATLGLEPTALAWEVLLFATSSLLSWRLSGLRHQVTWDK